MSRTKWSLRFLALILSILIWVWIQLNEHTTRAHMASMTFLFPDDLVEINPLPKTVSIEMIGPKGRLRLLEKMDLSIPVDLRDANPGQLSLTLDGNMVSGLPDGVTVERFTPPIIDVEFATPIIREVPLKLNLIGTINGELSIAKLEYSPKSISVKGAETILNQTSEVLTKPINLTELTESTSLSTQALLPSNTLSFVNPSDISVTIEIIDRNLDTIYSGITVRGNDLNWEVDIPKVDILMRTPIDQDIDAESLQLQVNIAAYIQGLGINDTSQIHRLAFSDHPDLFSIQGPAGNDVVLLNIEPNILEIKRKPSN